MNTRIRLALVDDHKLIRQTWRMVLEKDSRIEVVAECASGMEAIECARVFMPDVMLMDINMIPISGFEATRQISECCPTVKIIGTSINNQLAYVKNIMQLGARGYVTKNSPSEEMLHAIVTVHNGGTFLCKDIKTAI